MKLLSTNEYNKIERFLRTVNKKDELSVAESVAINEIIEFFNDETYKQFLEIFYTNRHSYKNRYPGNRALFKYLSKILFVQEPTLYVMRKEILYKSAMILYKYDLMR